MTVQVNRHFAEVAQQTRKDLFADLVRAFQTAYPEKAGEAVEFVKSATDWMGRNITTVDNSK